MGPGPLPEADRSALAAVFARKCTALGPGQSKLRSEWLPWLPVLARPTHVVFAVLKATSVVQKGLSRYL